MRVLKLDCELLNFEVDESLKPGELCAVDASGEAGVTGLVGQQYQRHLAHVHVKRVEANVEEAVEGLTEVLRQ